MDWKTVIGTIAPTVASALGGPLAGAAVSAIGSIFGLSEPSTDKIKDVIENAKLTGEQVSALRELELKLKAEEAERGFRYAELEFKDRDSARQASVQGGTLKMLFWLSLVLLVITLGTEMFVLFKGYPNTIPDMVVGRVLGLMDAVAMMVLAFWYGSSNGSERKTELMAQSPAK